jgi:GalNAc-alpha-(1->4)-GalNAc-alpha-(1->3)-diNAcBac-PP-undecaprenol alpha-1,4-N-acetyl-D-galactosaminyltransferase
VDKAGKAYWDALWTPGELPTPVDPRNRSHHNYVNRRLHEAFKVFLDPINPAGKRLIEVGCARSEWLPYFAREFRMQVAGLDYSEIGCRQERAVLDAAAVRGEIFCADVFDPPPEAREAFDVAVSFGVVEHFDDTSAVIAAIGQLLKKGGSMITLVPNMAGIVGFIQKTMDRPLYDIHVVLTDDDLRFAHSKAGLDVSFCEYFLSINFGVNNLVGLDPERLSTKVKARILRLLNYVSSGMFVLEGRSGVRLPPSAFLSPYVLCTATKPADAEELSEVGPRLLEKPLRLTLVISCLSSGGAERVMSFLANQWASTGRQVTLITLDTRENDAYPLDPRIERIGLDALAESPTFLHALGSNYSRVRKLRRAIRDARPDVVISFIDSMNILTLFATLGMRVPVVISPRVDPRQHRIGAVWSLMRRLVYPRAAAVVMQTQDAEQWMRQRLNRRATTIPNPLASDTQRIEHNAKRNLVLAAGRLTPQKGFDLLLRAFAAVAKEFPDWQLTIAGEGEERGRLESLVQELSLCGRVLFPGKVADLSTLFAESDLFVLSSRYEGFPNVLLEAMAAGLAVIAFDARSGPADIIRNGIDGVLVENIDPESLAAAMRRLMSSREERTRLAARATEVRKRFRGERVMPMWDRLLARLCGGRS